MSETTLIKIKRGDTQYTDAELLKLGEPALTMSTTLTGTGNPQEGYTVSDYNMRIGDGQTYGGVQFLNSMDSQTLPGAALDTVSSIRKNLETGAIELASGDNTIYNRYYLLGGNEGDTAPMFSWTSQGANREVSLLENLDMASLHIFGRDVPILPELYQTSDQISIPTNSTASNVIYVLGHKGVPLWDIWESLGITWSSDLDRTDLINAYFYFPAIFGPYPYSATLLQKVGGFNVSYVLDEYYLDNDISIPIKEAVVANSVVIVPAGDVAANASACTLLPVVFKQFHSGKYGINMGEQGSDNLTEYGFPSFLGETSYYITYYNSDLSIADNFHYRTKRHFIYFDRDIGTSDYSVSCDIISYDGGGFQRPELSITNRFNNGFIVENQSMADRVKIKWSVYRRA